MIKLKELINELVTLPMGEVHSNPYVSSFKSPEQIQEDGHTDVASAKRKLQTAIEDSQQLLSKLQEMPEEDSLPSWWTDKLTLSANYLNTARDYLLNPNNSVKEGIGDNISKKMDKHGGTRNKAEIEKIYKLLIKRGNTKKDAMDMIKKNYDKISKSYRRATPSKKAEILVTLQ